MTTGQHLFKLVQGLGQKFLVHGFQFICLFGVLRRFQHCTGHITTGSWKGRGNQYIQFARVLYCKLPTNGKQLPAFPLEAVTGIEPRSQRWEARVLPLCHRGPLMPFRFRFICCFTSHSTARVILQQVVYGWRNQCILVGQDSAL